MHPSSHVSPQNNRAQKPAVRRGLAQKCPNCGEGALFTRYLKVADHCAVCGEPLHHHRADDGPAYLTILIVAHLVGFGIHFAWAVFRPHPLLMALVFSALCVALSLYLLPRLKGMIVAIQWSRRMHGFGTSPSEHD